MGLPGFPARVPTDSLPPGCSLRRDYLVGRDARWTGAWCCPPHPVVRLRVAWCRAIQLLLSWGQKSNNVQGQAGASGIYKGFRAPSSTFRWTPGLAPAPPKDGGWGCPLLSAWRRAVTHLAPRQYWVLWVGLGRGGGGGEYLVRLGWGPLNREAPGHPTPSSSQAPSSTALR